MSDETELFPNPDVSTEAMVAESDNTVPPQQETPAKIRSRTRVERKFPAMPFSEAVELAEAIQQHAAGQKVRKLTLFEKLDKSPDSSTTRQLITSSGQYGLTKGAYSADFLELTPEGRLATSDDGSPAKRLAARFELAIKHIPAFFSLYETFKGSKMPAREVLADSVASLNIPPVFAEECLDTFIVNAKSIGLLRTIGGAERLISTSRLLNKFQISPHLNHPQHYRQLLYKANLLLL